MYSGPLSTRTVPVLATPFDDPAQTADDAFGGQGNVHFDPQPFAVEIPYGV